MTDGIGTLRWWGESWHAPVCDPCAHVPVPVGVSCSYCDEPVEGHHQGITVPHMAYPPDTRTTSSWHLDCWLRNLGIAP